MPAPAAAVSLTRDWWQPRLTARTALLLPVSWLFGLAAALRRALYRCHALSADRLAVPVIVVGNLTLGGSGKTPLVIALVRQLAAQGYRPGVISRGYRRATAHGAADAAGRAGSAGQAARAAGSGAAGGAIEVTPASAAAASGDEPLLIARATGAPVFVDASRVRAGRALLAAHPQVNVLISDDGLQHYALARDIEIAVFDARGAGNGQLLPAGPLREPLSRAAGLSALVHNAAGTHAANNGLHQRFPAMHPMKLLPQRCYRLIDPAQTCAIEQLAARVAQPGADGNIAALSAIAAIAGIGHPERFFATLRAAGLTPIEYPFPDHHAFTGADLAAISAPTLIMTEKDALKCSAFNDARIWVLPVTAQLDAAFYALILEKLRGHQAA